MKKNVKKKVGGGKEDKEKVREWERKRKQREGGREGREEGRGEENCTQPSLSPS